MTTTTTTTSKGQRLLTELWLRSKQKYTNPYRSKLIRDSQDHENMLRYLSEISDSDFDILINKIEKDE